MATVTVFAAASTTDVVAALARQYEAEGKGRVVLSFASSSTAAKQIAHGAPADVFISADKQWMDYLAKGGYLESGTRRDFLSNRLVLIAPKARPFAAKMDKGFALGGAFAGRLALGDPSHVPAGRYARAALEHMGWWGSLKDRLAPAADVRAALRLVELGEAGAAVVYATDAARSGRVVVVGTFPADSHPPIRYAIAVVRGAAPRGRPFVEYVLGPAGAECFTKHGFEVLSR